MTQDVRIQRIAAYLERDRQAGGEVWLPRGADQPLGNRRAGSLHLDERGALVNGASHAHANGHTINGNAYNGASNGHALNNGHHAGDIVGSLQPQGRGARIPRLYAVLPSDSMGTDHGARGGDLESNRGTSDPDSAVVRVLTWCRETKWFTRWCWVVFGVLVIDTFTPLLPLARALARMVM